MVRASQNANNPVVQDAQQNLDQLFALLIGAAEPREVVAPNARLRAAVEAKRSSTSHLLPEGCEA